MSKSKRASCLTEHHLPSSCFRSPLVRLSKGKPPYEQDLGARGRGAGARPRNGGVDLADEALVLGGLQPEHVEVREHAAAADPVDAVRRGGRVAAVDDVLEARQDLAEDGLWPHDVG